METGPWFIVSFDRLEKPEIELAVYKASGNVLVIILKHKCMYYAKAYLVSANKKEILFSIF